MEIMLIFAESLTVLQKASSGLVSQ